MFLPQINEAIKTIEARMQELRVMTSGRAIAEIAIELWKADGCVGYPSDFIKGAVVLLKQSNDYAHINFGKGP